MQHVLTDERCVTGEDGGEGRATHNGTCRRCEVCGQWIQYYDNGPRAPYDLNDCPGPAEPAQVTEQLIRSSIGPCETCKHPSNWHHILPHFACGKMCCTCTQYLGPPSPPTQPPAEPDVDEVRRALDSHAGHPTIIAAARAYLRLREQQPQQHPTIAQVVEACGVKDGEEWRIELSPDYGSIDAQLIVGEDDYRQRAFGPTFEAAIRQLYEDGKAELERQRDEAIEKLAKLGA